MATVIFVMIGMNQAGNGHKNLNGSTQTVCFGRQCAVEAQIVPVAQEILFASHTVPRVRHADRKCLCVDGAFATLQHQIRIGDIPVIRQTAIFGIQKIEVAQVRIQFVPVGMVTAEEAITEQLVSVGIVVASAVDVVHLATQVDFLAEIPSQQACEPFVLVLATTFGRIENVRIGYLRIVEACILGCRDVVVIGICKDKITGFGTIGKDQRLSR